MPPLLRRFAAAILVLFICAWVISEAPSPAAAEQEEDLQAFRNLQTRSRSLMGAGKHAEALPLVQQLHAAYPSNHIFLAQLAEIQERLGDWPACANAWEAYLKVSPTPWEAFPGLGEAYRKQGRLKDAIDACQRGVLLDPGNSELNLYLGLAYEHSLQYQKAEAVYREALKEHPDHSDLKVGLARMALFSGKTGEARRLAEEATRHDARSVDGFLVLGMALRSQGDLAGARRRLEQARDLSPDYLDVLQVLGGVAEQQNDDAAARAAYERILQLDPQHAAARTRLAGLNRGGRP